MIEIKANTVLPAKREAFVLHTQDGLDLVGELATPVEREPRATLLTLHPLPTHGGMMDSHVLRKAAWRLPALADLAVVRFNTRGSKSAAGRSDGNFDEARGERLDVEAALDFVRGRDLPDVWLLGWSFGTDLALMYGLDPLVRGALLLSPPLRYSSDDDLDRWSAAQRPVVAVVPELDDYVRPDEARRRLARVSQARVVAVEGAKHLWVGEKAVRRALDEVVSVVAPWASPLPTTWDGPFRLADPAAG